MAEALALVNSWKNLQYSGNSTQYSGNSAQCSGNSTQEIVLSTQYPVLRRKCALNFGSGRVEGFRKPPFSDQEAYC